MKKLDRCILLLILSLPVALKSQDVSVSAAFDTTSIMIGDQIHFSVTVEQPSGMKLEIPVFRDTIAKYIEILSGPHKDTSQIQGNRLRITDSYLVTSFDSGYYKVKPVYAELNDIGGLKRYFSVYSILEVHRVRLAPPDTSAKIFDIKGPYRAPLTLGELLPWILVALLAAAITWMVIRLIKLNRRTAGKQTAPVITEPAHVIAFRELEKLKEEQLWQKGETKKYYTRLTEIVRQYLENRFDVYSMEMTTSETLQALLRTGFKRDEHYNRLKMVFTAADLVKFAKHKPDPDENEKCFSDSWEFVSGTKAAEPTRDGQAAIEGKEGRSHE
jgi:hypothetical protein